MSRREFVFTENVNRNRPETNVQKLHSVKSLGKDYELYTRNLSCYCDACVNGQSSECENVDIVSNWEQRNLDIMAKSKDSQNAKRNQLTTQKQPQNQQRIPSKRKSDSKKPLRAKRRKVEETTATTSQQSVCADYTPGDFVVVGLKPRKEPISVYIAEVTHVYKAECGLKYMKKSGNTYV